MAQFVNPLGPKIGKGQVRLTGLPEWTPAKQLPEAITFEGSRVPLWTYQQLEELSAFNLKQRALNIRDTVGENRLPQLQKSAGQVVVAQWIIEAQVALANAAGLLVTAADFGLPAQLTAPTHVLSDKERTRFAHAGIEVPSYGVPQAAAASAPEEGEAAAQAPTLASLAPKPGPALPAFMQRVTTTQAHYGDPALSPSKGENSLVGVPKRLGPPLRLG